MQHRKVADVMTREVVAVAEETPFTEIVAALDDHGIRAVPVVDGDRRVVGIVTDADLLRKEEFRDIGTEERPRFESRRHRAARTKAAATHAAGLMSAPVVTLEPGTPVAKAARTLAAHGHKQAPVVDGNGRLVGIVTRSDLLRLFLRSDDDTRDEIVREVIVRGLWQDPSRIDVRVDDGVVVLSGRLEARSLIPICLRLTAATEGVVDVVDRLCYDRDDSRPGAFPRA
ncbi:CBS domain-containing protein [Actinomadura rifamycini]|uniref:CBS domain-containing protein n=1 Tax=Actinomadura rifamycini TaxID=31962 RepID=UPI000403C9E7|nr:CBS domain-containing protein [Actinomadura rifamycini]